MNDSVNRSGNQTGAIPGGKGMEEEGKNYSSLIQVQSVKAVTRETASFGFGATV